jgi:hypothetical protein
MTLKKQCDFCKEYVYNVYNIKSKKVVMEFLKNNYRKTTLKNKNNIYKVLIEKYDKYDKICDFDLKIIIFGYWKD